MLQYLNKEVAIIFTVVNAYKHKNDRDFEYQTIIV